MDAPPTPRTPPPAPRLRHDPPVPLGTCGMPLDGCRFHDPTTGTCRRHAPMRLDVPGHPNALWPRVEPGDWCGKWEPPLPGERGQGT